MTIENLQAGIPRHSEEWRALHLLEGSPLRAHREVVRGGRAGLRKLARVLVGVVVATSLMTAAPSVVLANEPPDPDTVVIGGREYGPEDGLVVETSQYESGGEPVGEIMGRPSSSQRGFAPLATWGSSYAISEEFAFVRHDGRARAAANIFNGLRIIEVRFWYTRNGVRLNSDTISRARSDGTRWIAGPEVRASVNDSLGFNDPPTIFNIRTSRIDPRVY